jgi:DNA-binding NarL/FixJ family response regulator
MSTEVPPPLYGPQALPGVEWYQRVQIGALLEKHILIGDDSEIIRKTLRRLLETQDHWVVVGEAVDGIDAVKKADELKPDLVVLDLAMPQMNGIEATRELKRKQPSLPLVMFTNHHSNYATQLALSAGANAVVLKSDAGTLVSRIYELLGQSEPRSIHNSRSA